MQFWIVFFTIDELECDLSVFYKCMFVYKNSSAVRQNTSTILSDKVLQRKSAMFPLVSEKNIPQQESCFTEHRTNLKGVLVIINHTYHFLCTAL